MKSHLWIADRIIYGEQSNICNISINVRGKNSKTRESICEILQEESGQRFRETVLQLGSQNCLSEIRK